MIYETEVTDLVGMSDAQMAGLETTEGGFLMWDQGEFRGMFWGGRIYLLRLKQITENHGLSPIIIPFTLFHGFCP